jgi:hypothetical protein
MSEIANKNLRITKDYCHIYRHTHMNFWKEPIGLLSLHNSFIEVLVPNLTELNLSGTYFNLIKLNLP